MTNTCEYNVAIPSVAIRRVLPFLHLAVSPTVSITFPTSISPRKPPPWANAHHIQTTSQVFSSVHHTSALPVRE